MNLTLAGNSLRLAKLQRNNNADIITSDKLELTNIMVYLSFSVKANCDVAILCYFSEKDKRTEESQTPFFSC